MANAAPSIRKTQLEDRAYAAGGHVSIPVRGRVPGGRRVLGVEFSLETTDTQPGAGQAAQLGSVRAQLLQKIVIGRRVDVDGLGLTFLNWHRRGREYGFPAGYPATANGVFARRTNWAIEYADVLARDVAVNDGAIPSELWQDEIEIDFAQLANVFAATVPTLAGVLRTWVIHDSAQGKKISPTSRQIKSTPFSALSASIQKRGKFEHAVLYRLAANDPGNVTDTQVSAVTTSIDGEQIVSASRPQDLAANYNRTRADGSAYRVESQTAPVGGESINEQPGTAAAAGLGVTLDYLPLLPMPKKNQASMAAESLDENGGFQVDLAGTITAYRIAYVLNESKGAEAEAKAAVALKVPNADVHLKSSRGGMVSAALRRHVPTKFLPTLPKKVGI